ncbi:Proprotein convertase subtilisin/kexin type 5 [Crotalus adamanteus]|uniref:Proprotein convertase subtilisin/kexin type 5 n=1 Tax=Crotalus adamanteus TaxID=8729 RepID=A0AAW1C0W0_CROAD
MLSIGETFLKICNAIQIYKKGHLRFLYLGECRRSCPLGFYPSEKDSTCASCYEHCQECLNQTSCERCSEGYSLINNSCQEHKCKKDNPETCTSCIHNYYMYNQQCYRTCPQNTVPDDNSHICIACQPNCQSCDRYECYWCEEGFFLLEKLKLRTSDGLGSTFLKGRFFPYVPSRSLRSAEIHLFSVSSRHQIETERALKEAFLENAQVLLKAFPFMAHQNTSLSVIRKRCPSFFRKVRGMNS